MAELQPATLAEIFLYIPYLPIPTRTRNEGVRPSVFSILGTKKIVFVVKYDIYIYIYIQILRSIGRHGGRNFKNLIFLKTSGPKKLGSHAFITGPGRYRKLGTEKRNNSVKFAGRNSATVKSYDQQLNIVTSMKSTSIKV